MSALDMTMDIIRFWDKLYMMFQEIYNKAGGSFGKIKACKLPKSKSARLKYSKPRFGVILMQLSRGQLFRMDL